MVIPVIADQLMSCIEQGNQLEFKFNHVDYLLLPKKGLGSLWINRNQ